MPPTLTSQTSLLDYNTASISTLISSRGWQELPEFERIGAVYDYVRDEILFGYNRVDNIPASQVLRDGFGQCNTKGTLLMALLRAVGVPCRLRGFTIKKALQKGVVPPLVYPLAPDNILHSWVEVVFEGNWIALEGYILDRPFLTEIQSRFLPRGKQLCGYAVGTNQLDAPPVNWAGEDTYIQRTGINQTFGVFDTPDAFYQNHRQTLSPVQGWLYENIIRHWMNARVAKIRRGKRV